jgi:lipopolysaccharide/colanic/teichoic acid biosynthesis glycosyltransferase
VAAASDESDAAESKFRGDLVRRAFDVAVASAGLVVLLPILAACAVAVLAGSRGPVLYRSRRVGLHGEEFDMLKFRKMRVDATGPRLTCANDDRFTPSGRLLAKWKLDELPQLVNVIRGEMSMVGPRPEDPEFVARAHPSFVEVLTVRPGITGLSQLAFARESEILDLEQDRVDGYLRRLLPQKLGLDALYARERSLGLDARILAWTFLAVLLRREVAVHRATGKMGFRRRPTTARAGKFRGWIGER